MTKILIVEDDREINQMLQEYLSLPELNYTVIPAYHGMEALNILRQQEQSVSLVLLDLMLPFYSGETVLSKLREFSDVPVIVLSAKDTVRTRIDLIHMGADDYMIKPFDLDELAARIEAVLRRSGKAVSTPAAGQNQQEQLLVYKELKLDRIRKTVFVNEHPLTLTGKEYKILELLLSYPDKLFSKANLFESIWNEPYFNEDSTLKVHISNLRSKIREFSAADEYIETVWGMGYRLKP